MELTDTSRKLLDRILKYKALHIFNDEVETEDSWRLWDSEDTAQWFQGQGYTLYKRVYSSGYPSPYTTPSFPSEVFQEANYPYAYHNAKPEGDSFEIALHAMDQTGCMVFAQDSEHRHVVIKATHISTEEYRIYRFLSKQPLETMQHNCILPVLNILQYNDACFVVMPRWGANVTQPTQYMSMRNIILLMHSSLKALTFLHSQNIIHRDISFGNLLVNHFGNDDVLHGYWNTRRTQLAAGQLVYAMIDYDWSIMLTPDVKRDEYRLPAQMSFVGTGFIGDTWQGEHDYNPFAYDVGVMGYWFASDYEFYTQEIPLLAPFFDRMLTRNIAKRFTAEEALQFLDKMLLESTTTQLSVLQDPKRMDQKPYDRWEGLSAEFQEKWASYREPLGLPLSARILRTICFAGPYTGTVLRKIRWVFSRIESVYKKALRSLGQASH